MGRNGRKAKETEGEEQLKLLEDAQTIDKSTGKDIGFYFPFPAFGREMEILYRTDKPPQDLKKLMEGFVRKLLESPRKTINELDKELLLSESLVKDYKKTGGLMMDIISTIASKYARLCEAFVTPMREQIIKEYKLTDLPEFMILDLCLLHYLNFFHFTFLSSYFSNKLEEAFDLETLEKVERLNTLAVRANNQFLKNLSTLRELKRISPSVKINSAENVCVADKQLVNIRCEEKNRGISPNN